MSKINKPDPHRSLSLALGGTVLEPRGISWWFCKTGSAMRSAEKSICFSGSLNLAKGKKILLQTIPRINIPSLTQIQVSLAVDEDQIDAVLVFSS